MLRIRFRFTYMFYGLLIYLIIIPMRFSLATPPSISADTAIVMDVTTGEVLFEKNARKPRAPASTTKILTAIVALEKGNLQEIVTVSRHAAYTEGSSVHLSPGEKLSLDDLLVGLLLRSGNDSAVAIAEHIAGTEQKFAELSNVRAKELGAKNTIFRNPHGLSAPGHLTTAYDLAILTRYALTNLPRFADIVSTREDSIDWDGRSYDRQLRNTNKLLWMFEGADGVKTGTTKEAGQCLVSSATREGQQLIAVVLHSGNRWNDSVKLLQHGFDHFTLLHFGEKDAVHQSIPVIKGMQQCVDAVIADYVEVIVPKSQAATVHLEYDIPQNVEAPVYRGQKIGEITVYNGTKVIKVVDLVAGQEVLDRTPVRVILNHLLLVYHKMAGWGWF